MIVSIICAILIIYLCIRLNAYENKGKTDTELWDEYNSWWG